MQGPSFTFLTNAYVEWLGLEPFLYHHKEPFEVWITVVPGVRILQKMKGMDFAVVYNHGLYFREPDGRAWVRKP